MRIFAIVSVLLLGSIGYSTAAQEKQIQQTAEEVKKVAKPEDIYQVAARSFKSDAGPSAEEKTRLYDELQMAKYIWKSEKYGLDLGLENVVKQLHIVPTPPQATPTIKK